MEKDFWVCYTLDFLFHRCKWSPYLVFKGGTSLSKAYHLISRFSEDIDLTLDWRVLGYGKDEPWQPRSNTKQDKFNKEADARAEDFLANEFAPVVRDTISEELGLAVSLHVDDDNRQMLVFEYPRLFESIYTLQVIRLEIGALAAWSPSADKFIQPYVTECFPTIFNQVGTTVRTACAERTFWEKATILHHEANRPAGLAMPDRYSRHYYDLYQMSKSPIKDVALARPGLLQKVAEFKMKFYPRGWAHYEDANPGTLRLMPPAYRFPALEKDYMAFIRMMYGEIPTFDEILDGLAGLEAEINKGTLS